MSGLNSKMWVDTDFLNKLNALPDDIAKAAHRAVKRTNEWFRAVTMAELGYSLEIDQKTALRTRFRVYNRRGSRARLWVGIRDIGVHRLGAPKQLKDGVAVGKQFFKQAFISPMNSSELLVWRRTGKSRKSIRLVTLEIAGEAEDIIGTYQIELNRKFQEYFSREFHALYRA
ncbi:phage tail protein [Veronia pacifica]|uniref:Phage tail protein n=1 Tax=Veronia pacifica TaxID=1080227 RepID=A0A1C3E9G4_9GAMM|nr:phage tail protein [Veronia pacifica]ODA29861.1 phage tail protein [Veronia pacifica]